jgi:hypothetical protein
MILMKIEMNENEMKPLFETLKAAEYLQALSDCHCFQILF